MADDSKSKSKWAESDSESSDSKGSSSSSEEEKVPCLMADDSEATSSYQQVFDFSSLEFTRAELVTSLHEMVEEYQKLAKTFDEVKAKQDDPKGKLVDNDWERSVDILALRCSSAAADTHTDTWLPLSS